MIESKDRVIRLFDVEGDSLNPTLIHCLVYREMADDGWGDEVVLTDYEDMREFFRTSDIVIGHNIIMWDIPVLERLLQIKVDCEVIDTLPLSWYRYPDRFEHGLEVWGVYFGVPKPKISNWSDLPLEDYIHRCSEDVKINTQLFDKLYKDLKLLYDSDEDLTRFVRYLMFKMECAQNAETSRWKLDVDMCRSSLSTLEELKQEKVEELKLIMPDVIKFSIMEHPGELYKKGKVVKKPKTYYKKDGSLSSTGERFYRICKSQGKDPEVTDEVLVPSDELTQRAIKWLDLLESKGLPETHTDPVEYEDSREEPNPNSIHQVKDLLFSLGWKPINFNYNDKGEEIPQVRIDGKDGKELCPSVKRLIPKEPSLKALEGLTVLTHRIGILKGYLKNVDDEGYIQARIQGFTNTLRFKHTVVVNLPSVKKPYGKIVRGVLTAPEGYVLCGSDMASLEDRTKQHYMWEYDPDYVREMQVEDFDPHLALAEFAGALTPEQVKAHKEGEEDHGVTRHLYKTANYSCTYGAGGAKLALTLDIPESEGKFIVDAYRKKNWSLDEIARDQTIKLIYKEGGRLTYRIVTGRDLMGDKDEPWRSRQQKQKIAEKAKELWLWNPVSKFWYSLRYPKDIFSTLNQGTGVFCFDTWIGYFMSKRRQITGQMHDEVILCLKEGYEEEMEEILRWAIDKTNERLQLNRDLDIDVQFGKTYADIH